MNPLHSNYVVEDWGLIDYEQALQRQEALVDQVHQGLHQQALIFCSHPPVVTVGRGTKSDDVTRQDWTGPLVEVRRGGRATYHGPSQVVVYPIVKLKAHSGRLLTEKHDDHVPHDIHGFMRSLERAVSATLKAYGIAALTSEEVSPCGDLSATGVWVKTPQMRKIASIGVGVRHWVTYHGLALNVDHDPRAFFGIRPCGFSSDTMISMQEILGSKIEREALNKLLLQNLVAEWSLSTKSKTESEVDSY